MHVDEDQMLAHAVLSHWIFFLQPFEEYWSKEDVQRGLKSSDLVQVGPVSLIFFSHAYHILLSFQGVLRINQRNYEDAFVDDPVLYIVCVSRLYYLQFCGPHGHMYIGRRRGLLCEWDVEEEQSS